LRKNTVPHEALTPRERDVVRGIVNGRTNREIAAALGITQQAVKNVLSIVYQKCNVRNRLEMALYAVRGNLVRDDGTTPVKIRLRTKVPSRSRRTRV